MITVTIVRDEENDQAKITIYGIDGLGDVTPQVALIWAKSEINAALEDIDDEGNVGRSFWIGGDDKK